MQLVTFERMLIDRLNGAGQVQARSFGEVSYPFAYGVVVQVDGGTVPVRLTRGSGTGDPKMTEAEQAAHDENIARLQPGGPPRSQHTTVQVRKVENLMRDVLAADLPPSAVLVEGPVDGRDRPGVKIRFDTGAEIYLTPMS